MQDNDTLVLNRENTAQKVKFSTIKEEIGGSTIVANPQLPENAPRLKSVEINGEVFNNETDLTEINTTINDIQADRIRSIDYTLETANWVDSGEETTPFKYTLNLVAPINVDNDTTFMNTANSDFSVKYGFYLSSVSYNTATPTNITCIFKAITQPTENISATLELIPQGVVGSIEQTITPNPNVTEASPTLSSLGIDGTNYKLLGSGGGSNVQANVTTTDTDPYLTSLQINNDKYRAKNYDNEIATLNQNVNKNAQDIENINTNISTLNTNVNKNTQDIENINTNISTLNTNVNKNTQDIENIITNGTLVAGDGISITDNTISVDLDNYDGGSF